MRDVPRETQVRRRTPSMTRRCCPSCQGCCWPSPSSAWTSSAMARATRWTPAPCG